MLVALSTKTNILVHGMHGYALYIYIYIYIYLYLNLRSSLRAPGVLSELSSQPGLENTAIYRTAAAGRSKWQLAPARGRRSARNGCSSPLGAAVALEMAARARLGAAGALGIAARARLGRSKWPFEPRRRRWGARNGRSSSLGLAGALEMAARARSASPGRSKSLLRPARLR